MNMKKTIKPSAARTRRTASARPSRTISAGTTITSAARNRQMPRRTGISASRRVQLTPAKQQFADQLKRTSKRAITAATNTSNIMARPDFLELIPLFVQKLLILDVYGSVAMKSRQQLIPYFKFIAENTKGETQKGTILSSPFVNRQGMDPNFTGRVVKNETVAGNTLAYVPVLPGSVTLVVTAQDGTSVKYTDNGAGGFIDASGQAVADVAINYATGVITGITDAITATYQYDNETVGPDANGQYGAKMAKGYLQLDEFNLVAEAHELACYWSIYSAFATQNEYGANLGDIAKEAALSEITAEINAAGFARLAEAAQYKPQFDWDASPVLSGSVVPSDYLNMFKLKLGQAAASIYQATRLSRPNRLIVGSTAKEYIAMIDGYVAETAEETVGPYKAGRLDEFEIYVDPNYDPNSWVMACKSNDIRRNSALFGEYMPVTSTDQIGLANTSVQQGYATMYGMKVVNPQTVVSGKILGTF